MREKIHLIPPGILILVTAWLRLANLGYSDYQGDEVKALAGPVQGQNLINFLLEQKKGPAQFVLTYLINWAHPSLTNEFLTRLPFALVGILGIYFFYKFVYLLYGRKIAIYAALLLSINGLFVGLTRIVQYQPLVLLFSSLALYFFTLALKSPRWATRGLYFGVLVWSAAILSHYDGVFIAPFAAYLMAKWYAAHTELPRTTRRRHLVITAALGFLFLATFYLPFFIELRNSTIEYWLLRASGEDLSDGRLSSIFTFQLYNPLLALYLYIFLAALSLLKLRTVLPVWFWLLFPWIILEVIIADPGTHIYTYLLPGTILAAFGIVVLEDLFARLVGERISNALVNGAAAVVILFLFAVSHLIFIDHTPEYPWEQRRILLWTVGAPDGEYKVWAFGFPYNRQWEAIRDYVASDEAIGYYASNESKSLAGFYLQRPFDVNRSGYYIHIYHPQSFRERLADDKIRYWTKNYPPVKTYLTAGKTVAEIYDMPPGNKSELRSQGY